MHKLIFGEHKTFCINQCLTLFNDGVGTDCFAFSNQQLCGRCVLPTTRAQPSVFLPQKRCAESDIARVNSFKPTTMTVASSFETAYQLMKRQKVGRELSADLYVQHFRTALNWFTGNCIFCKLAHSTDVPIHPLGQCPSLGSWTSLGDFFDFSKAIRYSKIYKNAICYFCHVPAVHDRLHATFDSKGTSCTHPNTLAAIALFVFERDTIKAAAANHFHCNWGSRPDFIAWLCRAPSEGHYSRTSELFLWYVDNYM